MTERPPDHLDEAIDRVAAALVAPDGEAAAVARCRARFDAGAPVRPARLPWWAAPSAASALLALVLVWSVLAPMPTPPPAERVTASAIPEAIAPVPGPVSRGAAADGPIDPRPATPETASVAAAAPARPQRSPHVGLPPLEAIDPLATDRLPVAAPLEASAAMQPLSIDAIQVTPLSLDGPE
ncbi:MAG: hypothetical protein AB7O93_24060 [Vicinamibacterales bacterium]